jgi:hypothetical protein
MKYKKIYKKFMEKTDIQWISLQSLINRRVMLRSVFEATIDKHLEAIRRVQRAVPFSERLA